MFKHKKKYLLKSTQAATSILVLSVLQACSNGGGSSSLGNGSGENPTSPTNPTNPSNPSNPNNPSNPALAATLDGLSETVTLGTETTFTVTLEGAEGTPQYSLSSAPEGMVIDRSTGVITWTPKGLMFGNKQTVSFTVTATDSDGNPDTTDRTRTITSSTTIVADNKRMIVRSSAKTPTLENAIKVGDFDKDGQVEILSTDNKGLLYTLELNKDTNQYEQSWVYPYAFGNGDFIKGIDIGDINKDGFVDFIVLNASSLNVIDGEKRELLHTQSLRAKEAYAVAVADIDNDQTLDIAALTSTESGTQQKLSVYKLDSATNNLTLSWESTNEALGKALVIGQMDSDAPLEIATQGAFVFDGQSQTDQWSNAKPNNWGEQLVLADLDNDGVKEIATMSGDGFVSVYSAAFSSDLFARNNDATDPDTTACAIAAGNVDSDPEDELIVGQCAANGSAASSGSVTEVLYILTTSANADGTKQTAQFQTQAVISRPVASNDDNNDQREDARTHSGFLSITLADTDGDGDKDELIWANRFTDNNFYSSFKTIDLQSGKNDISNIAFEHETHELGILNGDFLGAHPMQISASKEAAVFSSYSTPAAEDTNIQYGEYAVSIDYETGKATRIQRPMALSKTARSAKQTVSADIENKGYDQLVLSVSYLRAMFDPDDNREVSSYIAADLSSQSNPTLSRASNFLVKEQAQGPIAADNIDSDGISDIILNTNNQLQTFSNGDRIWNSTNNFEGVIGLELGDINNDDISDLSVMFASKTEIRQRLDNKSFYESVFGGPITIGGTKFTAQALGDLNQDGNDELVIADQISNTQTKISVYTISDRKTKLSGSTTIDGSVQDIVIDTRDGRSVTLLVGWTKTEKTESSIGQSYLSAFGYNSDLNTINPLWQSKAILGQIQPNSMSIRENGQILIGTEHAMYIGQ